MPINRESYKQLAKDGLDLLFPVKINGKTISPDVGIIYHSTIKLFDPAKDKPEEIHKIGRAHV